jgi:hypothetical protein
LEGPWTERNQIQGDVKKLETKYRATKFAKIATESETHEQMKKKLTPAEFAWMQQPHVNNKLNSDHTVDLLVKAGLVEEVR